MKFNIDHINVTLLVEKNGIRLKTDIESWFIPNQTIEETQRITQINFRIVKNHFLHKVGKFISAADLDNVSLNIVLNYFQMYNH